MMFLPASNNHVGELSKKPIIFSGMLLKKSTTLLNPSVTPFTILFHISVKKLDILFQISDQNPQIVSNTPLKDSAAPSKSPVISLSTVLMIPINTVIPVTTTFKIKSITGCKT